MANDIVLEMLDIIKQLNPDNQKYILTLARIAKVAENNVRKEKNKKSFWL